MGRTSSGPTRTIIPGAPTAGASLDELQRELLDRALGRLLHVQELGRDQLPVGDEPGVRLEAEEVLGRVDGDASAVDLDAGQAAPALVERLGQYDRTSDRTRKAITSLRSTLSIYQRRKVPGAAELARRAREALA